MSLDGLLVHHLVRELRAVLVNARLQRIQQPNANTIVLSFRQPGTNYCLLLSADPERPRAHLIPEEETPPNPTVALGFCMLLRKHLEPARLLAIEQPQLERMVTLRFETRDVSGKRAERLLITELMGRHSNILLVDPTGPIILDGIRRVSASQSRYREVFPGKPYLAPPRQEKEHPFDVTAERFLFNLRHTPGPVSIVRALMDAYQGFGPDAAREVVARAELSVGVTRSQVDVEQMEALWQAFHVIVAGVALGDVQPWGGSDEEGTPDSFWIYPLTYLGQAGKLFPTANVLLDWYYSEKEQLATRRRAQEELLRCLSAHLAKAERRLSIHQEILLGTERPEEMRAKGELLLAYMHEIPDGASEATVPDYNQEGEQVVIKLDPDTTVAANAQAYFRRYRKARTRRKQARRQCRVAQHEVQYLESVMDAVQRASDLADLEEIREELQSQGLISPPRRTHAVRTRRDAPAYLSVTAHDGTKILIGKNNKQNDFITMKVAQAGDLWLHVKDSPGAHVVIRANDREIAPDTLALGLQLAAYYSKARRSSQVPVDYCKRRHVRKPKGAKPGFVIYDHHQTAYVTPDSKEIRRLRADEG